MANRIREIMTPDPVCLHEDDSVFEAARQMRDKNIGDVVVMDGNRPCGILTDRDIVVRALAEHMDSDQTKVGEICTHDLVCVSPDDDVGKATKLMRQHDIRRLPVVEGNRPIGFVSLGDLAEEKDPRSVLGDISSAPSNN